MITTDWDDYLSKGISSANIPIYKHNEFKVQCILDILEGCKYQCAGCYVNKRHNYHASALSNVLALNIGGMDDIVLGPTDFFGADNILDILKDERMLEICSRVKGIQHNTSIDSRIGDDFVLKVIKVLEGNEVYSKLNYDVQIAIDADKVLFDKEYQQLIDERWKIFEGSSLKYEVSLLANIDPSVIGYENLQAFVADRWNTVVEYVPSIMRSPNIVNVKTALDQWKAYNSNYNLHADASHKSFNHIILNFNKDKIYLAPFVYENAAVYSKDYLVEGDLDKIYDRYHEIINWQYENAGPTCQKCDYLNQCVTHLIPYFTINTLEEEDYCPLNVNLL